MTEDEQEALSARYILPRVMRLTSGRFALFTGRDLDKLSIIDGARLLELIPSYDEVAAENESAERRPFGSQKLTSLNLADLGL